MNYNYSSPQEAIISLEEAYTNNDLHAVIALKDFRAEARLILEQRNVEYDLNDAELISETAVLLELSLVTQLEKNGFPDFTGVRREFSDLYEIEGNIYAIMEELIYPDGTFFVNKIFLSVNESVWKVAMVEE
jgi:hypothetical protein